MPQGDFFTFSSSVWGVSLTFILGYFFFVSYFAPQLLLFFRVQNWIFTLSSDDKKLNKTITMKKRAVNISILNSVVLLSPVQESFLWPEIMLLVFQFALLVFCLSLFNFLSSDDKKLNKLSSLIIPKTREENLFLPIENFFLLWSSKRETIFFTSSAEEVKKIVQKAFSNISLNSSFSFFRLKEIVRGLPEKNKYHE